MSQKCDELSVDDLYSKVSNKPMSESLLLLSQAIKKQRLKIGLSQEELANRCGFDRTYISMLERGKRNPSFLNVLKLAKGLETSISKLTESYNGLNSDK